MQKKKIKKTQPTQKTNHAQLKKKKAQFKRKNKMNWR